MIKTHSAKAPHYFVGILMQNMHIFIFCLKNASCFTPAVGSICAAMN